MGPNSTFADIALTPANGGGGGGGGGKSFASPVSQRYRPQHHPPTPHTPGQLDFPGSFTDISPRTGMNVRQHFQELQAAASPFNKEKYKQQKQQEEVEREKAAAAAIGK